MKSVLDNVLFDERFGYSDINSVQDAISTLRK